MSYPHANITKGMRRHVDAQLEGAEATAADDEQLELVRLRVRDEGRADTPDFGTMCMTTRSGGACVAGAVAGCRSAPAPTYQEATTQTSSLNFSRLGYNILCSAICQERAPVHIPSLA